MTYRLYEDVPLNKLSPADRALTISKGKGEIGCHRLVMNVYSD